MREHFTEPRPVATFLLRSSVEPLEYYPAALMVVPLQHLGVTTHSVIVKGRLLCDNYLVRLTTINLSG